MAELYFPFASSNGDRMVGVETYERMLGSIFTQGVFPRGDMLAVSAAGNMELTVAAGSAILVRTGVLASLYHNTTPVGLTCAVADGVASRIDTVVLRRDNSARKIGLLLLTGVPASQPTAAEPLRNGDYWDLVLCRVRIRAGATEILQSDIEDCRMDQTLCGIVTSLAQLDSGAFYAQQTALFDAWFAGIQGLLEGDVAGNLAGEIMTLQQHTSGVTCEIFNGPVTLSASGWTENVGAMRKEYRLEHVQIKTSNNPRVILPNALAGKTGIQCDPRPYDGYVLLYTADTAPSEDIEVQLIIEEVRSFA